MYYTGIHLLSNVIIRMTFSILVSYVPELDEIVNVGFQIFVMPY